MSSPEELSKYSREQIFEALVRFEYKSPACFKWFFFWELGPSILMTDVVEKFYQYPEDDNYASLFRFKEKFPVTYQAFFMYELEKPFSPFERQPIIFLNEEDTKKLGLDRK